MDARQIETLIEKKKQLRLKLAVRDFIHLHVIEWLPVMDHFKQKELPFLINHLACINEYELPYWKVELEKGKLASYKFDIAKLLISDEDPIHEKVLRNFPNTNPLRYVPDLPLKSSNSVNWKAELTLAADELAIESAEVIFFYLRYSPVLTINMEALLSIDEDPLGGMSEDMVICTSDYSRMICRTLEDDWYWGSSDQYK